MYAKAIEGMSPTDAVKWAHGEMVTAPDLVHAIECGAGQLQPGRRFEFAINRD